jgi:hypothetical protein
MRPINFRRIGLLAALACISAGSGCASMNHTEQGALTGGVIGTGAGTVIGAATGRPLLGAALGAAVGTGAGALVGNEADKDDARRKDIAQAAALEDARYQQQRMGVSDVIRMTRDNYSPQIIINQIRTTRSTFDLTLSDLDMLKNNGVSDSVIAEMQAARGAPAPAKVYVREPRQVIYEPYPPPPVVVRPAPVLVVGPPRPYYYRRYW